MNPLIVFENDDFLAINKPSGMVVNRADSTRQFFTVQDWIEEGNEDLRLKIKDILEKYNVTEITELKGKEIEGEYNPEIEFCMRSGVVHRLDKETSGILLIAKNPETFSKLKIQFQERTTKKVYIALVHGVLKQKEGEIDAPVGRLPWNRTHFGVLAEGREAQTFYSVVGEYVLQVKKVTEQFSLVELEPKTGRTHQIRVHMKHIGHPLVSDELYTGRKTARSDREWCKRLFLHAKQITITNPTTNQPEVITASLPDELQAALTHLQKLL
jgi:RluA family pseudouridine synthase